MRSRADTKRTRALEVQALYSIPALARVANVTQQTLRRVLAKNGVEIIGSGRARYVPLSEIQQRIPALWESIKTAEALRQAAKAR